MVPLKTTPLPFSLCDGAIVRAGEASHRAACKVHGVPVLKTHLKKQKHQRPKGKKSLVQLFVSPVCLELKVLKS